jgi:putative sterol carrier protein
MSGKLKVRGNIMLATKLGTFSRKKKKKTPS